MKTTILAKIEFETTDMKQIISEIDNDADVSEEAEKMLHAAVKKSIEKSLLEDVKERVNTSFDHGTEGFDECKVEGFDLKDYANEVEFSVSFKG